MYQSGQRIKVCGCDQKETNQKGAWVCVAQVSECQAKKSGHCMDKKDEMPTS